jgi:hypothetical protein
MWESDYSSVAGIVKDTFDFLRGSLCDPNKRIEKWEGW